MVQASHSLYCLVFTQRIWTPAFSNKASIHNTPFIHTWAMIQSTESNRKINTIQCHTGAITVLSVCCINLMPVYQVSQDCQQWYPTSSLISPVLEKDLKKQLVQIFIVIAVPKFLFMVSFGMTLGKTVVSDLVSVVLKNGSCLDQKVNSCTHLISYSKTTTNSVN